MITLYDTPVAQEADELVVSLQKYKIKSFKKEGWPTRRSSSSYKVIIAEKDYEKASIVLQTFELKLELARNKMNKICGKCKSENTREVLRETVGFFKRIWTSGTRIMNCDDCENEWYI